MTDTTTKTCTKCGRDLPVGAFWLHAQTGLPCSPCKECKNAARRDARSNTPRKRSCVDCGATVGPRYQRCDTCQRKLRCRKFAQWRVANQDSINDRQRARRRREGLLCETNYLLGRKMADAVVGAIGGADFAVAMREVPCPQSRSGWTWIAYILPLGTGTRGTVVLHVTQVAGVWNARMSPTLEVRWRRAAGCALRRLERSWSRG